jgi:energy-coupling factor transporter transmembrane protein EcfT
VIQVHPATRLLAWAALVVFAQLARGPILWALGLVVIAMAALFARQRARRLVRRIRILLSVLVVLFAFFTPGEVLLPFLGGASPTREGLALALLHCMQLLIVVLLVALLLELTNEKFLVSGLMFLARPLALVGLSVERMAVRMLLVFRYVETPPEGGWRALLSSSHESSLNGPLSVTLVPLRWWDVLAAGGFIFLVVWGAVL